MNDSIKIISRKDAKCHGSKRYFTGKPCKFGHIDERFVSGCNCVSCKREDSRKYRKENPKKRRESTRKYREANIVKCRESSSKSRKKNFMKVIERGRKYREDNLDKERERNSEKQRKYCEELSDVYVKAILRQQYGLTATQITPEIIAAKRNQLQTYRLMKEILNGIN